MNRFEVELALRHAIFGMECSLYTPKPCVYGTIHASQPLNQWIRRKRFYPAFFQYQISLGSRVTPHWLSPVETEDALTTVEVMDAPMNRGFVMLAQMESHDLGWREQRRWVLVDDDWGTRVNNTQ